VGIKREWQTANAESAKALVSGYLERIKNEENPEELDAYRKIVRQGVPFFLRSYFAAYLLKMAAKGVSRPASRPQQQKRGNRPEEKREGRRGSRPEGQGPRPEGQGPRPEPRRDERKEEPPSRLPEGEAVTLFIGIGKNRRAYIKDLLQLFAATARVDRSQLGSIKIMDNYSFVQIRTETADDAIAALNGTEFRGRKLVVNYARKKGQGDETAAGAAFPERSEKAVAEEDVEREAGNDAPDRFAAGGDEGDEGVGDDGEAGEAGSDYEAGNDGEDEEFGNDEEASEDELPDGKTPVGGEEGNSSET
jgi:hypothetical protein